MIQSNYRFRFSVAVALAALCTLLFLASPATAATDLESRARDIDNKLMAPCCGANTVREHDSGPAMQMRAEIRQMLAAGKSEREILDHFVTQHGEKILAMPDAQGFNLLAYLLPVGFLFFGGGFLFLALRRWRKQAPAPRVAGDGPVRVVSSHEEITALKLTEEALKKSQEELIEQKQSLEETNIAMKVLLKQREEDKLDLEKKVLNNVKNLVLPYVEKLKNPRLKARDRTLVDIIDTHLHDIISPLLQRFTNAKILLTPQEMQVASLVKSEKKRNPAAPFTTSTLQQEANRKLGFSARKTMSVAQKLYEGIDIGEGEVGLITYMRTDSVALSSVATDEAKELITSEYGAEYAVAKPRTFKNRAKNAQEAHEAVRPTSLKWTPKQITSYLSADQIKLYKLIWERTMASQMASAILDATPVDLSAGDRFIFRSTGQVIRFPGFMKLYIEGTDNGGEEKEGLLPDLSEGEKIKCEKLHPNQHFTQPPARFTEASLVEILEEHA